MNKSPTLCYSFWCWDFLFNYDTTSREAHWRNEQIIQATWTVVLRLLPTERWISFLSQVYVNNPRKTLKYWLTALFHFTFFPWEGTKKVIFRKRANRTWNSNGHLSVFCFMHTISRSPFFMLSAYYSSFYFKYSVLRICCHPPFFSFLHVHTLSH